MREILTTDDAIESIVRVVSGVGIDGYDMYYEEYLDALIPKEGDLVRILSGGDRNELIEVIRVLANKQFIGDDFELYDPENAEVVVWEESRINDVQ